MSKSQGGSDPLSPVPVACGAAGAPAEPRATRHACQDVSEKPPTEKAPRPPRPTEGHGARPCARPCRADPRPRVCPAAYRQEPVCARGKLALFKSASDQFLVASDVSSANCYWQNAYAQGRLCDRWDGCRLQASSPPLPRPRRPVSRLWRVHGADDLPVCDPAGRQKAAKAG